MYITLTEALANKLKPWKNLKFFTQSSKLNQTSNNSDTNACKNNKGRCPTSNVISWYCDHQALKQLCPTETAYWSKNHVTILTRATRVDWFKSSNKIKDHVILELCLMSMTYLICILIGFHIYSIGAEGREFSWRYKLEAIKCFVNHTNCEVADSISFNCKNDMWTEFTRTFADSKVITASMPQVLMCGLA